MKTCGHKCAAWPAKDNAAGLAGGMQAAPSGMVIEEVQRKFEEGLL